MNCLNCNKETKNPKYCSRSCAAIVNNSKPKRVKTKQCATCTNLVYSSRKYCQVCLEQIRIDWNERSIGEIQRRAKYQISAQVRNIARIIYKNSDRPKACEICGYDKHYEVCHKKAIKDFDPTSLISEVNNLDNLVALCPNHHWELDNGIVISTSL